jgi:enoyl-[acyl-carrier protein] reductase I
MGILDGRRILITGVLNTSSIAYRVAELALDEGAEILLTGFGRGLSITRRAATKLGLGEEVVELDVSDPVSVDSAREQVAKTWPSLDGIVHSIGFAPPSCLDQDMCSAPWSDVAVALHVSAYSLSELVRAFREMLTSGSGIVGLDFDATVAWPGYNWMGVAKAGLESLTRYLARDLGPRGVRVNLVSAGPIRTVAAKSIESFRTFQDSWSDKAPLGWDPADATSVAKAVLCLLSSYFPMTTGEIVHVDGGYHILGA